MVKQDGTKLDTLSGEDTRPTLDRVKEALFNIIQSYIYDAKVLDLFSGSGALAIESISRGAKYAISCDNSKKAIQIIKTNIQKCHFTEEIEVINKDYKKTLEDMKDKKFDIIFLDPPYKTDFGIDAIEIIMKNNMLEEEGIVVFETDRENEYIDSIKEYANVLNVRKYGRVKLVFVGRKE
ncbi:MAG: 16S rRNA (guanine(966)-N(2))-methyltransferase RsmD [Clostridia bacterium]|nr:16S rRNA (guanine(966)-N(2))-methyltransferase RsmD [Clostridia bacterium]MCI9274666.1 16S rRNA (guanine(966)-N(2))-methyltransferase RsmD [Clostridia bacterium]